MPDRGCQPKVTETGQLKKGQEQNYETDETWQEKCDVTKEKQRKRNVKTTLNATSFLTAKHKAEVLGQKTQGNLSPDASCENFVNNRGGFETWGIGGIEFLDFQEGGSRCPGGCHPTGKHLATA